MLAGENNRSRNTVKRSGSSKIVYEQKSSRAKLVLDIGFFEERIIDIEGAKRLSIS
jgi:hypothetical protein